MITNAKEHSTTTTIHIVEIFSYYNVTKLTAVKKYSRKILDYFHV